MNVREQGQASVELVALLPLLVAGTLALSQLVLAGHAAWAASSAARAAARALAIGGDPALAARRALPGRLRAARASAQRGRAASHSPCGFRGRWVRLTSAGSRPAPSSRRRVDEAGGRRSGQASVELVALLPLVVVVAAVCLQLLAAAAASDAAAAGAQAGAMALLQDRDPQQAVRAALRGWPRRSTRVRVAGRRVTVTVRPRGVGALAAGLTARSSASAGPASAAGSTAVNERGGDGALTRPRGRR